jgi:hypothetical protein
MFEEKLDELEAGIRRTVERVDDFVNAGIEGVVYPVIDFASEGLNPKGLSPDAPDYKTAGTSKELVSGLVERLLR